MVVRNITNETNEEIVKNNNIQSEICVVGSFYKQPDLYVSYGKYVRSKYDFSDEVTKFLYDTFELMYTTFSQTIDESKVNIFMSQDETRLKLYKNYGGYKLIEAWTSIADVHDFKNYFNILKKYSLVREYERNGYPINKIIKHPKFETWNANDIYRIIRTRADQINTIINAQEESVVLNSGNTKLLENHLIKPDMGLPLPWKILTEMFRGCRLKKVVFNGFLSNEGKTRNMMLLIAYIVLVLKESFLLCSNEMDEEDLKNCLITTVINNKYFQELHGVKLNKPEKEIVLGIYKDDNGNVIERKINDDGFYIETEDEYIQRVYDTSTEFRQVQKVAKWIDKNTEGKLFFKDVGSDYSDKALEFEFRKHRMVHGVKYCGYDTLKGYQTDDWQTIKQTATKIKELMKELNMFCWAVFQLTDETTFTNIMDLSSSNIANCKHIKHIADMLMLGKKIEKKDYHKYQYYSLDDWGKPMRHNLNENKQYFAIKVDKNRGGNKQLIPIFEINLDYNIWNEIGYVVLRQ